MSQCGDRIKKAREAAGMTQEELGRKVGVTGVAIMRYEKGSREPKLDTLRKIARALDVDPIYMLSDNATIIDPTTVKIPTNNAPKSITFNTNIDPEWAALEQKIKDGTITSEERQRFAELNQQAINNAREKFEFEKEKIRNLLSKLTVAELFDVLDLVTEEVKKQTNGEESK